MKKDNTQPTASMHKVWKMGTEEQIMAEVEEHDRELLRLASQAGEEEKLIENALDFLGQCEVVFPKLRHAEHRLELRGLAGFWAGVVQPKIGVLPYVDLKPSLEPSSLPSEPSRPAIMSLGEGSWLGQWYGTSGQPLTVCISGLSGETKGAVLPEWPRDIGLVSGSVVLSYEIVQPRYWCSSYTGAGSIDASIKSSLSMESVF